MDSRACPFCARALPRSFARSPAPRLPRRRTRLGAYSHTAAASLLAAAACGGLTAGTRGDGGDDGAPGEAGSDGGDASSGFDAPFRLGSDASAPTDAGPDGTVDASPCDSGPAYEPSDCGDLRCGPFGCSVYECVTQCHPVPPYGKVAIED